jgi:hypothetical protein
VLDQNIVTAQWGLLGVFGVMVTLLIRHANQHYRAYLREGTEAAYQRALSWSRSIRRPAWTVLVILIGLALLGLYDAGIVPLRSTTVWMRLPWLVDEKQSRVAGWVLLALPPLAQAAFLRLVVRRLAQKVKRVVNVPLEADMNRTPSPKGERPETVLHFVNDTLAPVQLDWIDWDGILLPYPPIPARGSPGGPPGRRSQRTYGGHRFLLRGHGWAHTVTAPDTPGQVVIDIDVKAASPPPRRRQGTRRSDPGPEPPHWSSSAPSPP